MNRRAFLGSAGAALSVGLLGGAVGGTGDELLVRVWVSDAAAEYDALGSRVRGYLRAAFEPVTDSVRVEMADEPVALPTESGRALLARYWPRLLVEGAGGLRGIDPVGGINLLVTDGNPADQPAGFARPHVAATTGARQLARMPPPDDLSPEVPYSFRSATAQLLLHECGHALGLSHDHGVARTHNGRVIASPMVSSYLWASEDVRSRHLDESGNACGHTFPPADAEGERWVRLRYSQCALRELRAARE